MKIAKSYCEEHKSKEIEFYCYDCRTTSCVVCYVDKHNQHKCSDINKAGDKFRDQMNDDIVSITSCVEERKKTLDQLEADKTKFVEEISSAGRVISKRYDKLRSLIDLHQKQLMDELDEIKVKHLKEIEMRRDEDERQLLMLDSYKKYCEEMKEKATACDISRAADDLHLRAVELIKSQEKYNSQQRTKCSVSFKASELLADCDVKKLFGMIQTTEVNQPQAVIPARGT